MTDFSNESDTSSPGISEQGPSMSFFLLLLAYNILSCFSVLL